MIDVLRRVTDDRLHQDPLTDKWAGRLWWLIIAVVAAAVLYAERERFWQVLGTTLLYAAAFTGVIVAWGWFLGALCRWIEGSDPAPAPKLSWRQRLSGLMRASFLPLLFGFQTATRKGGLEWLPYFAVGLAIMSLIVIGGSLAMRLGLIKPKPPAPRAPGR